MGSLNAGDLALLRSELSTQTTTERLYAWGMPAMWKGRVNEGSPTRGMQTIDYDGGAMETGFQFADILPNLMVWFGTSEGSDDLGRRLLLSITGNATSGTMVIDWNDSLSLSNNDYITIVHYYPPWPRFSWFTATGPNFVKNGPPVSSDGAGLDYTSENTQPPPHIPLGRPYADSPGRTASRWWIAPGVPESSVQQAIQAVGADSATLALLNLHNPGTNDAINTGSAGWADTTGFTLNGVDQYLRTTLTPDSDWTIIVRAQFPNVQAAEGGLLTGRATDADFGIGITVQSVGGGTGRKANIFYRWGDGSRTGDDTGATPTGADTVMALAGKQPYTDGIAEAAIIAAFTGTPVEMYVGAENNGGAANFLDCNILAWAIYDTTLTTQQISTITTAMAALDDTTAPPTGIQLYAGNSQAVAPGASISSYSHSITPSNAGATIANSTSATAQLYAPPGRYYHHCTVTDSNGKTSTGHRPVIVDDGDFSLAINEFTRGPITEQFDSYSVGCQLTLTSPDDGSSVAIRPDTDWSGIPDESMVIIAAQDKYGSTEKTISFRDATIYTDRENIVYVGYLIGERRNLNPNGTGSIEFDCVNAVDMFLYSLSITGVRAATDWYEMDYRLMTIAALSFHLLKWHSTLLEIQDWWLPWSDDTKRSAVEEWTEGNILERLRSFVNEHGRLMNVTANAQGEVWVQSDPQLKVTEAARNAITTTLTLADKDITAVKRVRVQHRPSVSQVFFSGGASTGQIGGFEPFFSISQNVKLAHGVQVPPFERLMVANQTEANQTSGRLLAVFNRKLQEVNLNFSGNYREVFSPAGLQWTNTGQVFENTLIANIRATTDLEDVRLVPRQVTRNPAGSIPAVSVVFDVEAPQGLDGRTLTFPEISPAYVPSVIATPPGLIGEPREVLVNGDDVNGFEVLDPDDDWEQRNTGLSGDSLKIRDLQVTPYWWLLQGSSDWEDLICWIATDGGIYTTNDAGKSWINRTPLSDLDNAPAGVTPATVSYYSIDVYSSQADINRTIVGMARETVTGTVHSWLLLSTDGGLVWTSSKVT